MLTNYKNSELILNNQLPLIGQRVDTKILNLLKSKYYLPDFNDRNNISVELHLYSNDGGYLIGEHNVSDWKQSFNTSNNIDEIEVNLHSNISSYGFIRGNYKFVYNFHIIVAFILSNYIKCKNKSVCGLYTESTTNPG